MDTELFPFQDDDTPQPGDREPATTDALTGEWERYLPALRERHPGQRDGVLFCVWKLEGDPELNLRDFRDEAALRGVSLSGRSVHSAKVLLGLEKPATRRKKPAAELAEPEPAPAPAPAPAPVERQPRRAAPAAPATDGGDLELALRRTIDQAVEARTAELREAMRRAIELLRDALGDD